MEFEYTADKSVGIFHLSGSLIGEHDGMPLADSFNERMEEGTYNFIVDLTELKHINSSGIGVLITLMTRSRKKDGDLVLVNPSDYVKNLMIITKLNQIFKIFDSNVDAMKFFEKN